ncbi:(2Fe-2S)-binding protein [Oleiagrimonas sp.]|jgi:xanthine dehydrogenase YagT iron-sulfur-binding subunit|uniref:(2Fe-2S)-binding protein n=1 Tax=Oleiagrimonas sp. TaxID=2010330 RepID=UPI002616B2E0|nr:(2Fe-2S)-binding protein [Oleiagrimonas sp.]MDA3914982.1 (2Fe-2S)-binding protein [Oleiagrimonas sp.]
MSDTPPHDPHAPHDEAPTQPGRRSFLRVVGITGAASSVAFSASGSARAPLRAPVTADGRDQERAAAGEAVSITLKVNGRPHRLKLDPRTTLLDTLREHIGLTGTKKGCDHGQCGACTVHVNGRRVNSCLSLALMHDGDEITTIEGLGRPGQLHPMQHAFLEHDGYQCGYCTSGQIMSATAMLKEPVGKSDADVREAMSGNICRCGAYANILAAIKQVREG